MYANRYIEESKLPIIDSQTQSTIAAENCLHSSFYYSWGGYMGVSDGNTVYHDCQICLQMVTKMLTAKQKIIKMARAGELILMMMQIFEICNC